MSLPHFRILKSCDVSAGICTAETSKDTFLVGESKASQVTLLVLV